MARARRAKVKVSRRELKERGKINGKGCLGIVITMILIVVGANVWLDGVIASKEESKNNSGFEHSFVENIEVEEIEVEDIVVETIEGNFKPITFEDSTTYWD